MDVFVFKTATTDTAEYRMIDDIPGESRFDPTAIWGSDGASREGMHVDPVIPGAGDQMDGLTMPRVLGRIDPMNGEADPHIAHVGAPAGFEDPLFG